MRAQSVPVHSRPKDSSRLIPQRRQPRPLSVRFAATMRYDEQVQRMDEWDEQFILTKEEVLDKLMSRRTMRIRDAVDSLQLPAMKASLGKGQFYVFVEHSKLYELHGRSFVARLAQIILLELVNKKLEELETQLSEANVDVEEIKQLTKEIGDFEWVQKKVETNRFVNDLISDCLSFENPHKLDLINAHPTNFAVKGGRIFDSLTQRTRARNELDFFNEELQVEYLGSLRAEANLYYQFKQSQYPNDEELTWQIISDGYLMSAANHEESYSHKWSSMGGNGKDVEVAALRAAFGDTYVVRLPKETVLLGVHCNYGAELQRLRHARQAYVDELNNENIDLDAIKTLSSHGVLDLRDCREKGKKIKPFHSTHSLITYGNVFPVKYRTDNALQRRLINQAMKRYFRDPNSPGYNLNDPNCQPINTRLVDNLTENVDHVFTYYMNASHAYYTKLSENPNYSVKQSCPESIKTIPPSPYQSYADENLVFESSAKISRDELYENFKVKTGTALTKNTKPVLMNLLLLNGAEYKVCRFKDKTVWAFAGVRLA